MAKHEANERIHPAVSFSNIYASSDSFCIYTGWLLYLLSLLLGVSLINRLTWYFNIHHTMKILQIINCHYCRGGADVIYLNTAELLKSKDHSIVFFWFSKFQILLGLFIKPYCSNNNQQSNFNLNQNLKTVIPIKWESSL